MIAFGPLDRDSFEYSDHLYIQAIGGYEVIVVTEGYIGVYRADTKEPMRSTGWGYGIGSTAISEVSVNSPAGMPIWPLKMLIPVGGGLMVLQGVSEVLRCLLCLREGQWPARLHDVEELENQILKAAAAKLATGKEAS